jgi:hypothetical protein
MAPRWNTFSKKTMYGSAGKSLKLVRNQYTVKYLFYEYGNRTPDNIVNS